MKFEIVPNKDPSGIYTIGWRVVALVGPPTSVVFASFTNSASDGDVGDAERRARDYAEWMGVSATRARRAWST